LLESEGHEVKTAKDGDECMKIFTTNTKNDSHFDLVITDYRMPKNEGGRVIHEILGIKPDQKMLLISAYSGEILDLGKKSRLEVLSKPFDSFVFLNKIEKMLNTPSA
jgi:two-component system cell cycle response regulator CpdR